MARNLNDLADFLYSDRRAEVNSNFDSGHTTTIYGTASGDSSDGLVSVVLSDDVTQPDGMEEVFGTTVEVPTTTSVHDGDDVIVTLVGGDMKTPFVSGVVGAGDKVMKIASEAKEVAEATSQYFWHDTNGAHVSSDDSDQYGTFNSVWNSLGLLFRSLGNNLVSITRSAIAFFDGNGNADENIVASFGSDGALVGKEGAAHTLITDEETRFYDADGNEAGKISMSSEGTVPTSATYTITTSSTGTVSDTITGITPLPDFTLGYLVLRSKVDSASGSLARFESWSDIASPVTMSTSTIDYTFKATPNVDTWGIEITATNRSGYTAPQTVTYTLEWYYLGSAPQYKFGTGENAGAYSFLAGMGLKTEKPAQIVLGTYNEPSQTDLLIVGNGTSDENRSNVLSIDENNTLVVNSFSQRYGGVTLTQSALWGWEQALGLSVETIYETADITIKRFGRTVMVQCHGVSGTANNNVPLANVDMLAYKPSYNASAMVCDTQSTTHFARLWVSKDDGKPYLAFAGYSGASTWYGTLTYTY